MYCTECGCDRILLQNALNTLLQPAQPAEKPVQKPAPEAEPTRVVSAAPVEEPTRIVAAAPVMAEPTRVIPTPRPAEPVAPPASFAPPVEHTPAPEAEPTRVLDAATRAAFPGHAAPAAPVDDDGTRVMPAPARRAAPVSQPAPEPEQYDDPDDEDTEDARDGIAETLIRWVPPITAIVCAGIALWGFVYYQFMM